MSAIQVAQLKEQDRKPKSEEKAGFRTDIAGLRAVAVLLVLLCHFKIPGFDGGFIGPDIFFVISGFLITGLLAKEYAKSVTSTSRGKVDTEKATKKSRKSRRGKISFVNFYLRRARRILPASLLVIFCINVYAVISLNILQQSQIQNDSIWTLLFLANVNFLRQSMDYFAQSNDVSPLQHFWTLSVEEQFYLVWPVLFIAATRLNGLKIFGRKIRWRDRVLWAMVLLGAVSVFWLLQEFSSDPLTAYFSTFSRAWELAFGGILGFLVMAKPETRIKVTSPVIRLVSLLVLLGSVFLVTPENFGHTLFIPVLATGVLLLSGTDQTDDVATKVLSNKVFLWVGAISYSLYLWHWPVYVFGKQLGLMDNLLQRTAGMGICFILAALSYRYVELKFMQINLPKPAKKNLSAKSKKTFLLPAITTVLMISFVGVLTYSKASFGLSGIQAGAWNPKDPGIIGESPNASPSPGDSSGTSSGNFVLQAASKVSQGEQLATPDEMQRLLKQAAGIHDMSGGWKCKEVKSRLFKCVLGADTAKRKWFAMGDSHMEMWKSALRSVAEKQTDVQLTVYTVVHCANSLSESGIDFGGSKDDKAACMPMHQMFLEDIKATNPELVVLSDNTVPNSKVNEYGLGFQEMLTEIKKTTSSILVLGQSPEYPILERCLNKDLSNINSCSGSPKSINTRRQVQQQVAAGAGVEVWDPVPLLCLENVCPAILNKTIVSTDGSHLDGNLGYVLAPSIWQKISSILQ